MRIAHTLPGRGLNGLELRVIETALWQQSAGHEVTLLASSAGAPLPRAEASGLAVIPVDFEHAPFGLKHVLPWRRLINERRIEVLDTHSNRDSMAAPYCRDLCAIVRSRHTKNRRKKASFFRRLRWRASYDHVIACAQSTRDELVEDGLIPAERVTVVGEWADGAFFDSEANRQRAEALRAIWLPGPAPQITLGFVGAFRPENGVETALGVLARLRESGMDARGLFVGGGGERIYGDMSYRQSVMQHAASLGLQDAAIFTGHTDDVAAAMQLMDVLIVAPGNTAQTRIIPEAFASGLPVVAHDVGAISELVKPGRTGWLAPAGDIAAFAGCARVAAAREGDAPAIIARARALAETQFGRETAMEATINAYRVAIRTAREAQGSHSWILPRRLDHVTADS